MSGQALTFILSLAGCCFVLALAATWLAVQVAPRIGFVDRPGGHKSHRSTRPYGGGTAMFLGAMAPLGGLLTVALWAPPEWTSGLDPALRDYLGGAALRTREAVIILIGGAALHVLGLIDDVRPLGPGVKLPAILGVALLTAWAGQVRLIEAAGAAPSIALTVLWFGVIINAFNFLDNMDGLSGGVATICLAFLAVCGVLAGQVLVPALACVLAGSAAGFLVFNFPPARIFMGDAGSLLLGYWIAVCSTLTTYNPSGLGMPAFALAMPLVVLAVPLYDFFSVLGIRLAEGRNPLRGDQRHFSHRLVEHGLSRPLAVLTIYLATAATGTAATLLPGADLPRTLTVIALVLMVLGIIAILESPVRRDPGENGRRS